MQKGLSAAGAADVEVPAIRSVHRLSGLEHWVPWRIKLLVQSIVWRSPLLYFFYGGLRSNRGVYDRDFDLAVEGFPRSGNTYARKMFEHTNRDKIRIRSHGHRPPFVLAALQLAKPVALLVRKPLDAAVSWHIYTGLPLEYILNQYILYHRILLPFRKNLLIIQFGDLVEKPFAHQLERIEERFKLGLRTKIDEEQLRTLVVAEIHQTCTSDVGTIDVFRVNVPNNVRATVKETIVTKALTSRTLAHALTVADCIHDKF